MAKAQPAEDKQKVKKRSQKKSTPVSDGRSQERQMNLLGQVTQKGLIQAQAGSLVDSRWPRAQQQALVAQIGRVQGNRHLQRVISSTKHRKLNSEGSHSAAAIQREDGSPEPAVTLNNGRFAGNSILLRILKGELALSKAHNGEAVLRVQQALADMGYALPYYLVDGKFGTETEDAIRQFRADKGLAEGSQLDADAMRRLDQLAPPPGQTARKTLDYERMLEDDRLTFTLAFGYDENGSTTILADRMRDFLLGEGFSGKTSASGLEYLTKPKTFAYLNPQTSETVQKEVVVEIQLITAETPQPKASFSKGLSESDIVLYTGHARYGTGPDFDPKKSAAENFVIGVGSALHKNGRLKTPPSKDRSWYKGHRQMAEVLDQRANDLEEMAAAGQIDPEKYQVWFFNACTTLHYLDELRSEEIVGGKNRKTLDILGTRASLMPIVALEAAQSFILSVLNMETLDELMAGMQGAAEGYQENQYFHEGFGDNPTMMVQP